MTPQAPNAPPTPDAILDALSVVVEAHQSLIGFRVGVQMGMFKPGAKTRRRDHVYWMALCDAVNAGDALLTAVRGYPPYPGPTDPADLNPEPGNGPRMDSVRNENGSHK